MKKIFACLILSILFFNPQTAISGVTPLSIGLFPPAQFPPEDFTITGVRLSLLWGKHRDLYGLDLGVIGNITTGRFVGIGLAGIGNWTKGDTTILGLQLAGLANINEQKTSVYGLQASAGINYNVAESSVVGLQLALANVAPFTNVYGFQVGIYNKAKEVYGLQIGVVNIADSLHGIQIGLINFNTKGLVGVSPILNMGF